MVAISKAYKDNEGRWRWRVSYVATDPSTGKKRQYRPVIGSREQAELVAARVKQELWEARHVPDAPKARQLAMGDLWERYRKRFGTKRSFCSDKTRWKFIETFFGKDRRVSTIYPTDVDDLIMRKPTEADPRAGLRETKTRLGGPHSTASVNRHLALLRAAMNLAIEAKAIRENPVRPTMIKKERNRRVRVATLDELEKLTFAANAQLRLAIVLASTTTLRQASIAALTWAPINLERKTIDVPDTKNGEPVTVPLLAEAHAALEAWKATHDSPELFTISSQSISSEFGDLTKRLAIEPRLTFHDLRHTAATRLAEAGVSPYVLMRIGGWKTLEMMQRYVHVGEAAALANKR